MHTGSKKQPGHLTFIYFFHPLNALFLSFCGHAHIQAFTSILEVEHFEKKIITCTFRRGVFEQKKCLTRLNVPKR